MEERKQLVDVVSALGVEITTEYRGKTKRDKWDCYAWDVTLRMRGRTLSTPFYCGLGHVTKPKCYWQSPKPIPPSAADVIYSLAMDAAAASETFSEFCSNVGYDEDSRKALEAYLACQKSGAEFREFAREHLAAFQDAEH